MMKTDFNKNLRQMANDLQTLIICLTPAQEKCTDVNVSEAAAATERLVNVYKQMKRTNLFQN